MSRIVAGKKHRWFVVQFVYGGWMECACGIQAHSELEYNEHNQFVFASTGKRIGH